MGAHVEYLAFAITAIGVVLCLFFMVFMFWGSKIPGDNGKPQIIKYKGVELQTNSIVMVLLISTIVTVLPFGLTKYLDYKKTEQTIDLFVTGRVEDEGGKALEGAVAKVTKLKLNGSAKVLFSKSVDSDGSFEFQFPLSGKDKIKIETEKPNYRKQSVIIQIDGVQFHPVLVRKGE
jgi:hypothetical protein